MLVEDYVCRLVVGFGHWQVEHGPHLTQTLVYQFGGLFSFSLVSFRVPGEIREHLLNDPEWCRSGSMWAAGVWAMGDAAAELHSTSLGSGLS